MRLVSLSRFGLSRIGLRAGLCAASAVIQRKMYRLDTGRSWAASRCVLLNRQRSHPQRLGCAWPLLSPEAARDDCNNFLNPSENWADRAARLGWDAMALFGCAPKRPLDYSGSAGLP
jgi:hypothetical protein